MTPSNQISVCPVCGDQFTTGNPSVTEVPLVGPAIWRHKTCTTVPTREVAPLAICPECLQDEITDGIDGGDPEIGQVYKLVQMANCDSHRHSRHGINISWPE